MNTSTIPSPLCQIGMPRVRATTISAPKIPKIAPDAPTVGICGWNHSAPNDPASSEAKYTARKLTRPIAGSSAEPTNHSEIMLMKMCSSPSCRNPLVSRRQYSCVPV